METTKAEAKQTLKARRVAQLAKANAERKAAGLPVGRPKGSPNKMTQTLRGAVMHAFDKLGGQAGLAKWAASDPEKFYTLLLKMLPKEVEAHSAGAGITVVVQGTAQLRDSSGVTIDAKGLPPGVPFDDPIPDDL